MKKVMLNLKIRCIMNIHDSTDQSINLYSFPLSQMSEQFLLLFSVFLFDKLHCVVFFNLFAYLFDKTSRKCWTDVFNKLMFTDIIVMIYLVRNIVLFLFYSVQGSSVPRTKDSGVMSSVLFFWVLVGFNKPWRVFNN